MTNTSDDTAGHSAQMVGEIVLPLAVEKAAVSRGTVDIGLVRIETVTRTREHLVVEQLARQRVQVEHVPVNEYVAEMPNVREEGDLTVVPVVEEVLVVQRRLLLREEVRIRRVRTSEPHIETIPLRVQEAVVKRTQLSREGSRETSQPTNHRHGAHPMNEETIVAVFDTASHADEAVRDLEAANVPSSAISRHPSPESATTSAATQPGRERGFWSSLFGGEPDHDTAVYDRSVQGGSHVVTVKLPSDYVESVTAILERHHPVDIEERAASYGLDTAGTSEMSGRGTLGTPAGVRDPVGGDKEQTLQLAEEQIRVGKRLINRGTTRIRRFVVETPVEESISLHSERVAVERRPVTGEVRASEADFNDRVIEMTETDEVAVVGKTARVTEEVVIRKDASDHVETVHDTVRRDNVEITKEGGVETDGRSLSAVPPRP